MNVQHFIGKPWINGPLELLRHAEGHYQVDDDFDRRMALIGFDNAIEVAITSYLNLHPKQRGEKTFRKNDVQEWQRNYHTKIEFLEEYAEENQIQLPFQIGELIFYHQLRNELYHSGNGFVPEREKVKAIRQVAMAVFKILYDVDVENLLLHPEDARPVKPIGLTEISLPGKTTLLQSTIEFTNSLAESLRRMGLDLGDHRNDPDKLWELFESNTNSIRPEHVRAVQTALATHHNILINEASSGAEEDILALARELDKVTSFVKGYVRSSDILPELKTRFFSRLLSDRLRSVFVEIDDGKVNVVTDLAPNEQRREALETSYLKQVGENRFDIVPGDSLVGFSAEDNARRLLDLIGDVEDRETVEYLHNLFMIEDDVVDDYFGHGSKSVK